MTPQQIPANRQTLSYIRHVLQSRGLTPKNKMGQNFLIDLNLVDLILQTAELDRQDAILEVGTGTGSLTMRLCDEAGAVVSVELDLDFSRMAADVLAGRGNLSLMHADILERKNEMNPAVLTEWSRIAAAHGCTRKKLVANLPYAVATPVIANLLIAGVDIERMVVLVQWEMAERLIATPGTKDYSSLSVLVQSLATTRVIRRLAPSVFWPKPKVDSAIVMIQPDPVRRLLVPDPQAYRAFLRDLYTQRRKNLRGALSGWPSGHRDKKDVDERLATLGIDGSLRAESLDLAEHLRLFGAFKDI